MFIRAKNGGINMHDNIQTEIQEIVKIAERYGITSMKPEEAFNYLMLQYNCFGEPVIKDELWYDVKSCISDGPSDGGMDYVFFDEEESKVIVGQNKYSTNISITDCVDEINKAIRTIEDFGRGTAGGYSKRVREIYQNAYDRLTDETEGNIEIVFASISEFDILEAQRRLDTVKDKVSQITIINAADISSTIDKIQEASKLVEEDVLSLDAAKNMLEYKSDDKEGIIVNIDATSLTRVYNKHGDKGLFNLNIRRYIRNKNVDEGINDTLNNKRKDFWFLNNGLTIACRDFRLDGNTIKLYEFSIVNGGQTTTLIGKYKGNNTNPCYIACKILKPNEDLTHDEYLRFCNEIAEATNSQKPIIPRDLKANAPEMIQLQRVLARENVAFEIKRGGTSLVKNPKYRIRNDEFAQLVFSFINQRPGTARANKKSLFSNNSTYNKIFLKRYSEKSRLDFVLNLLELNTRFDTLAKKYKSDQNIDADKANIFYNGKCILFGLFGITYRIVNKDHELTKIKNDPKMLESDDFIYGSFISDYREDDIDEKLDSLVKLFLDLLVEVYNTQYNKGEVTSVSNFFKTDSKYSGDIAVKVLDVISRPVFQKEFIEYSKIFIRSNS